MGPSVRGIVVGAVGLALAVASCGGSGDLGVDPQTDIGPSSSDTASDTASAGPDADGADPAAAGDDGADPAAAGDDGAPARDVVDDSAPVVDVVDTAMGDGDDGDADDVLVEDYVGYIAPLTGQPASDPDAVRRRALVVKVGNNNRQSRPQAGLASADVVFELLVEGARTRFAAVYHSEVPARIGPVRSARTSDLDLLSDLSEPYFVFSGGNDKVFGLLRSAERDGILIDGGAGRSRSHYERDRSRRAPYNLYFGYAEPDGSDESDTPTLLISGDDGASPVQALFEYGDRDAAADDGSDVVGVSVAYPGAHTASAVHIWDPDVGGWVRIQDGTLHVTETGVGVAGIDVGVTEAGVGVTEIAPENVVVLLARYERSSADPASPHALSHGTGEAWLLTGGEVLQAVWERTEDRVGFRFSDGYGRPLALTPGRTWVLIANRRGPYSVAEVEPVSADDGERLLAEARAAFADARAGEQDTAS